MANDKNNNNNNNINNRDKDKDRKSKVANKKELPEAVNNPTSTTSLGKRRRLDDLPEENQSTPSTKSPHRRRKDNHHHHHHHDHHHHQQQHNNQNQYKQSQTPGSPSTMSNPKSADYGSQASPLRVPAKPASTELVKVAIIGASGGIGQPLSMLLMHYTEYIQHLALYDLVNVHGVGADLSHIDRQVKITTHLGPEELPDAVRDAKVIIVPAGLAQKPGMSRDDLFGSNSTIMANIAKVCAQVNPQAMLAIITNPVNSLVPLTCEVYARVLAQQRAQPGSPQETSSSTVTNANKKFPIDHTENVSMKSMKSTKSVKSMRGNANFEDSFRRIFGVTTLDVVRASTLTAKSIFFRTEPSGLFKDPSKISVPVVGGHAGKTIMPLLSQATPKIDRKRLLEEKASTLTLIESIQQAGIEVLNAKKGTGSATLAMAYAACRFTISLLRAQQGEQNIVECAYVKHKEPYMHELEYFSCPLQLGKDGYVKALPLGKLLTFEERMLEEGCKELRSSVAKGEDFAKEHLN